MANYAQSLAELMLRSGEDQAASLQRGGQIWGNLASQLGQIPSNVIAQQQAQKTGAQEQQLRAAEIADYQAQAGQRAAAASDQAALDEQLRRSGDPATVIAGLQQSGHGHLVGAYQKSLDDAAERKANIEKLASEKTAAEATAAKANQELEVGKANYFGGLANDVATKWNYAPGAYHTAIATAVSHGMMDNVTGGRLIAQAIQDPTSIKQNVDHAIAASPEQQKLAAEAAKANAPKPPSYQQKDVLLDGKPAIVSFDSSTGKSIDAGGNDVSKRVAPIPPASSSVSPDVLSDVKETIAGMKDGTLPPILPGRATKEYTQLLAEAHRQGYDLSQAATDWAATQKHIATLNSTQQTRLNQSINALPDLLDTVDDLASKWKGGRFPVLNKANLSLAKGGAYGDDVATVARQLDSQIADVTADLGSVYMGGNTPTDQALGLASKSLQGDWSEKVLKDMVALARKNVTIRRNSIQTTGVQGASASNPYAQPPAPTTPAPPATQPSIADLRSKYGY